MDGRVLVISVGHVTSARRRDTVRRCDGRGRGGHRGLSGTLVDDPPHTHTRAWMMRLGCKEVNQPSRGSGWYVQIDTGLGTKGARGSGVI